MSFVIKNNVDGNAASTGRGRLQGGSLAKLEVGSANKEKVMSPVLNLLVPPSDKCNAYSSSSSSSAQWILWRFWCFLEWELGEIVEMFWGEFIDRVPGI